MPFEQLLAVLPAASKDLLPKCYQVDFIHLWHMKLIFTLLCAYFKRRNFFSVSSMPVVRLTLKF